MLSISQIPRFSVRSTRNLLICCFFLSGACSLVYQIAWLRVMGLIFGNTTFATSTVLAGYMAGLGLGALWGGKYFNLNHDGLKVYGFLEGGIGLYAFLTPFLWELIDHINVFFYRTFEPSLSISLLFKFTIAFTALLIPTFLMGATLPAVSQFFIRDEKETAKGIGLLYALNTLGAVLGVLFSAFFLLQTIGVWQTVILTGIFNFAIFYVCVFSQESAPRILAARSPAITEHPSPKITSSPVPHDSQAPRPLLLVCFAISGAVSMMYEIGWTRILAMSLGSSVYAFSIMLATFLFGIAAGSYLFSIAEKYFKIDLTVFALLQVLTGFFGLIGMNSLNDMPYYFVQLYTLARGSLPVLETGKFVLASVVMLPPTLLIGAMFSCFIQIYRRSKPLGHELGEAYFSNTIGTIFGSAFTGFFIIPALGIQNTLILACALNALIGVVLILAGRETWERRRLGILGGMLALLVAGSFMVKPWNRMVIASELAVKPYKAMGMSKQDLINSMDERDLLFYKEGTSATVTVTKVRDNFSLAVNGKVDASNEDMFTQFLLGHLPMILHPKPEKALVIGLGSGSTVAAVAAYPEIKHIDAVELEPAVVEGARYFHKLNRNVLEDPRLKLHVNDGRNFALLTQEKYDVIISEPSNPWMAGVANLFSYEHYKTMSRKLNRGGIVCQWLHAYSMSSKDTRMIIKTFTKAFNHTSLWTSYYPDLMLIGSNEAVTVDFERIKKAFEIPEVRADLSPHGITQPEGLLASFFLADDELRRLGAGAKTNSDNFPYLEFSAPRHLYRDTLLENFSMLSAFRRSFVPGTLHLPAPLEQNGTLQKALIRAYMAKKMFGEAEKILFLAKNLSPNDEEVILLEGILRYKGGMLDAAQAILERVVASNFKNAEACYYLGLILQGKNENEKAADLFLAALVTQPENPEYLGALAALLVKMENFLGAFPLYQKLLEINNDNFDAWGKSTFILFKTLTPDASLPAIRKFIEKYPHFIGGYQWLAQTLEAKGEFAEAVENYKKVQKRMPQDTAILIKLAELNDRLGRLDEVKYYTKKAVQANPALKNNPQIMRVISQ